LVSTSIGKYISALSNSAALCGRGCAYLLWGVRDHDHEAVGTTFRPFECRVKGQELQSWLLRDLRPHVAFPFQELRIDDKVVVVLEVLAATSRPVSFKKDKYVRMGSYTKNLRGCPEPERRLWRIFESLPLESGVAMSGVSSADVVKLLDHPSYFELYDIPLPDGRDRALECFRSEKFIMREVGGARSVSNSGALLFAREPSIFERIDRKIPRVIRYSGADRAETHKEYLVDRGHASGFTRLIDSIVTLLPPNEVIAQAIRREVPMYPTSAIREPVANALIHQDFFVRGSGPMIEIFNNRMEIANPGSP
jgi:ATP-dependent DNA helicase RecG